MPGLRRPCDFGLMPRASKQPAELRDGELFGGRVDETMKSALDSSFRLRALGGRQRAVDHERLDAVASFHEAVAIPGGDGFSLLGRTTF